MGHHYFSDLNTLIFLYRGNTIWIMSDTHQFPYLKHILYFPFIKLKRVIVN
uniref:Uncharacterized protein n=1 Tax=Aegilops tauschii subsp. strangulata TaxID=200361 RepID=A0A453QC89_AEGTS